MKLAGQEVVAGFRERIPAKPGDTLRIRPVAENFHVFDAESGARL